MTDANLASYKGELKTVLENIVISKIDYLRGGAEMPKITRAAFVYLEPAHPQPQFAQCSTCRLYSPPFCSILGSVVPPGASCCLYVPGAPRPSTIEPNLTPTSAGYVARQVRCENCKFFNSPNSKCGLFTTLNNHLSTYFSLDETVHPLGCCNAQEPLRAQGRAP